LAGHNPHPEVAEIVARLSIAEAVNEIAAGFRTEIDAFQRLTGSSREEIVVGIERNIRRWCGWLSTGVEPADSEFEPLRNWARARAAEGVRLEDLQRALGVGAHLGWQLIRRSAHADEREALIEAAGLMVRYTGRASGIITDTYLTERAQLTSEEERDARRLLDRLSEGSMLDVDDQDLASRAGVPVEAAYAPFAIVMPDRSPRRHAALATRLRQRGLGLAVTDADHVVGVTWRTLEVADLEEGPNVILAIGAPATLDQLGEARQDLVLLAEYGRRVGLSGRIEADEHLLEILVLRSTRTTERLQAKVFAALTDEGHEDLLETLQTLVACRFDRAATCAALHIHRNTLTYRLRRIEELTALDLKDPRDMACIYMAVTMVGEPVQV
jgi:hypothetical protein